MIQYLCDKCGRVMKSDPYSDDYKDSLFQISRCDGFGGFKKIVLCKKCEKQFNYWLAWKVYPNNIKDF